MRVGAGAVCPLVSTRTIPHASQSRQAPQGAKQSVAGKGSQEVPWSPENYLGQAWG